MPFRGYVGWCEGMERGLISDFYPKRKIINLPLKFSIRQVWHIFFKGKCPNEKRLSTQEKRKRKIKRII